MAIVTAKAYVDENNMATVVCASCGRKRTVDATRFRGCTRGVRIKCTCSATFIVLFENRRYYRKNVKLKGEYFKGNPIREIGEIVVYDVSRTGIQFITRGKHDLRIDDIIKVTIVLDDRAGSVISQNVVVRRVKGAAVGAQFCDANLCKTLAFYLMP